MHWTDRITLAMVVALAACEVPVEVEEFDNPLDEKVVEALGIETPALLFFPDSIAVSAGSGITMSIFAQKIDGLAGAQIIFGYDKSKLSVVNINIGDFFAGADETIFISDNDAVNGVISIYTAYLGSDSTAATGTGSLATIVFTTASAGVTRLAFTEATELVDADDVPITIKTFGEGVINAN